MNHRAPSVRTTSAPDRLIGKWELERRTSLDISTIYRKIKRGTFPHPVRVALRRVAWRESEVIAWQDSLAVAAG